MRKLLVLTFILTILSIPAMAADWSGFSYSYDEASGVLTVSGSGRLELEAEFDNDLIRGQRAAIPWSGVEPRAVVIGEGVTYVGDHIFNKANIESVSLPASLEEIGKGAFRLCEKLREVNFAGAPKTIGSSAFSACTSLESVSLPEGVEELGSFAFSDCTSLSKVELPSSLKSIGRHILNATLYRSNMDNWANGVLYVGTNLIEARPDIVEGDYTVWFGTTCIADSAFGEYHYLGCTMPDSEGCDKLEHVTIPGSVVHIGAGAFAGCKNLWGITVMSYNKNYYDDDGFVFTADGKTLVAYAPGDDREEYAVPDGVTAIEAGAFMEASHLTKLALPGSIERIGAGAFEKCGALRELNCPGSLSSVGTEFRALFYGCESLDTETMMLFAEKANAAPSDIIPE